MQGLRGQPTKRALGKIEREEQMERVVLCASHGQLGAGLVDTARMVLGEGVGDLRSYGLVPGHVPDELVEGIAPEIEANPTTEFVVLTDVYGASVATAATRLLAYPNVRVFTGMNMAMLLSLLIEHPAPLDDAASSAIAQAAREGAREIPVAAIAPADEDNDF